MQYPCRMLLHYGGSTDRLVMRFDKRRTNGTPMRESILCKNTLKRQLIYDARRTVEYGANF